jgi:hypothetical protein
MSAARVYVGEHVARMWEGRGVYGVFVGRPEEKRPLGRLTHPTSSSKICWFWHRKCRPVRYSVSLFWPLSKTANLPLSSLCMFAPWCRILFEKLIVIQLIKKYPCFLHGTRSFITVFTKARHWTLSWASWNQLAQSIPISERSRLILSSHLRLGLPSCLLPSGLPTKTL